METTKRKERRKEAMCDAIQDAARDLVVKEGPDALTMRRVAEAVDYSVGALYEYFNSKDALVMALRERVHLDIVNRFEKISSLECCPEEQVRCMIREMWGLHMAPEYHNILLLPAPPQAKEGSTETLKKMRAHMERMITQLDYPSLRTEASIQSAIGVIRAFVVGLAEITQAKRVQGCEEVSRQWLEDGINTLLKGWS